MRTSFLKWSPDVDSAVDYYTKAAIADLYAQNGSFFHCAKAYESAALLYRDLNDYNKVVNCLETAGQIMRQNGIPDSATTLYSKGAKLLETAKPENSARFYEHAAETSELEEKYLQAADFATQAARIWVRIQGFKEADAQLRRAMHLAASDTSDGATQTAYKVSGKAVVALVIIKLVQEDSVAANKVYVEALEKYHFGETDDAMAVARLIQVYEAYDSAAASEALSQPTFRNLENEFARLARTIKFPEGFGDQKSMAAGAPEEDYRDFEIGNLRILKPGIMQWISNSVDSSKSLDPVEEKLGDVLSLLSSLKSLAPNPENANTSTDVKQNLANLSKIAEKLSVAADEFQNQFDFNEANELSESPSFLNGASFNINFDAYMHKADNTSSNIKSDALLDSVKALEEEIQKLPELIENSKRQFEEEIIRYYEEQADKLLSSTIETCLSISKEKIDELDI
ncbi:hypothetical protein ACTXT7_008385, partial [Hymenolepis weldensis]